jgi:hypothetical protein
MFSQPVVASEVSANSTKQFWRGAVGLRLFSCHDKVDRWLPVVSDALCILSVDHTSSSLLVCPASYGV